MTPNFSIQKFDKEYIKGCADTGKRIDSNFGNNDGKLQTQELFEEACSLSESIFKNNDLLKSKAYEINAKEYQIAKKYADKDGVITAEKHAEMINSKEWTKAMDEYRSMYKEIEASEKYGKEYYTDAVNALRDHDKRSGNGDGKFSPNEFYKQTLSLFKSLFGNDKTKSKVSDEIAKQQKTIMDKYAGADKVLSPAEYIEALNSDEYSKTLDIYWSMMP